MKSKNYILMQIHKLLMDNRAYTREKADTFIEQNKGKKVYELLVLRKTLAEKVVRPDVSYRRSIWHYRSSSDEEED